MPRTYGKAKQTRLSFAPIALPSEEDDDMARQATLKYGHPSRPAVQASGSKKTRSSSRKDSPDPFVTSKSAEDNETAAQPDKGSRRSSRKKDKKKSKVDEDDAEQEDGGKKVKHKKKKDKKKDKKKKKEKKEITADTPPTPQSPPPEAADPAEQNSDSDLEIQSSVRKPRALKRKRSLSPENSNPQSSSHADTVAQDNDEEEVVSRPLRKLRRGPAQPAPIVLDDSSDESDEPVASSPVKRRRQSTSVEEPQTPRRNMNQDELDLEEDLEDLQDSVVKTSRTRGRLANSARAQRQKHLETLRRRRAGQTETDEEKSEEAPEEAASDEDYSSEEDEDEDAVQQPRIPFNREDSDVESSIASNDDLDRYEKDFVLEDEDDKLGVPAGLEEMPIEFSRHSYKQLKDYFQDAVQWMVFNKLFPAFPRSSPIYKVAFDKLEDEVKGRTGSQLISSVWNADFCRALMARPHLEETTFPISEGHPCDACKRSGHPASFDLKFYGKAYSIETLEPLSDAESDEEKSDDEDDGLERDRDGHVLPEENIRFYLGRHCKNRATMAHTLTHWRFHLNEWVVDHLERTGYVSDEKILERSHWSQRRNAKFAGEAFSDMVEAGEIKKLWRDFHINLRTARESTTVG